MNLLWIIIIVLVVLWLLGAFGRNISPRFPRMGNWVHILIVLAIILLVLKLLGII